LILLAQHIIFVLIISQNSIARVAFSKPLDSSSDIKSPANVKSIEIIIIDDRFAAKIEANSISEMRQMIRGTNGLAGSAHRRRKRK
jgi:hypothetical protein